MGLLDDAIREHLELKRRRGADPTEVEREENEVLGAPRQGRFAGEDAEDDEAMAAGAPPEVEPEVAAGPAEPVPAADEEEELEPESRSGEPFDHLADEPWDAPEPPVSEPAPPPPPRRAAEPEPADEPWLDEPDEVPLGDALHHGQPTAEFSAAEADEAEGRAPQEEELEHVLPDEEPEGEDVLEETPDFLQETPEHDRLWFEQKPPRDFDFDDE
jgi:hypothetical protein